MKNKSLSYQIARTLIQGIGPVKAKNLIAYCGSAEAIFKEKKSALLKIPEIGEQAARLILDADVMKRADQEVRFIDDHDIRPLFYTDKDYPTRLKLCDDGPILLYARGVMQMNVDRVISIVGTRNASEYGKSFCDLLPREISSYDPLVVSGMAYGIDIAAHRSAVHYKLQTIGCLAHGLERVYPQIHKSTSEEMMLRGGLLSEFVSKTDMSPELFPTRNRIIAGMADCTIVVETDTKGGSIITAYLANGYGREVFALPGRHYDKESSGCNMLIKKNIAAILTSPQDLIEYLNWGDKKSPAVRQISMFPDLNPDETALVKILQEKGKTPIDELSLISEKPTAKLSGILLDLEFKGVVKSLPGKMFDLIK